MDKQQDKAAPLQPRGSNRKMLGSWLALTGVVVPGVVHAAAQGAGRDDFEAGKRFHPQHTARAQDPYAWTAQDWLGNNKPYQEVRAAIDKTLAGGQSPDVLLKKYATPARQQPSDPLAQFAWGYAVWKALKPTLSLSEELMKLSGVRKALADAPSTRTYEYSRLRFLVEARAERNLHLRNLGERLVRHNPRDYDVKYQLVRVLNLETSPESKQRALAYVRDLMRMDPRNPGPYSMLGGVHLRSWMATRSREDGDKAIAAYREYLRLAPANYQWRKQAEHIIQVIQREQARQKNRG